MDKYDIDMETLKKMKLYGAKIVDVRSRREYSEGHISGSINIPDYEINKEFEKIFKDFAEKSSLFNLLRVGARCLLSTTLFLVVLPPFSFSIFIISYFFKEVKRFF